jgi:hypothetical protein
MLGVDPSNVYKDDTHATTSTSATSDATSSSSGSRSKFASGSVGRNTGGLAYVISVNQRFSFEPRLADRSVMYLCRRSLVCRFCCAHSDKKRALRRQSGIDRMNTQFDIISYCRSRLPKTTATISLSSTLLPPRSRSPTTTTPSTMVRCPLCVSRARALSLSIA